MGSSRNTPDHSPGPRRRVGEKIIKEREVGEQATYDITAEEVCQLTKLSFPDELDPAGLHPVHVNPLPDDERVRVLSRGLNRNVKPHQSQLQLISNFFGIHNIFFWFFH